MLRIFIIFIILFPLNLIGQVKSEKHFYDTNWNECDSASAKYLQILSYSDTINNAGSIRITYISGQIQSVCFYSDLKASKRQGSSTSYFENGQLKSSATYLEDKLNGEVITYFINGLLKRRDQFEEGKFISGSCYSSEGKDTTHFDFEIHAQLIGSEISNFLVEHMNYPRKAIRKGIEGKVFVRWTILKNGSISDVEIFKSANPLLDAEAVRVVSLMKNWSPAFEDGEAVSEKYNLPINFKLEP